MSEVTFTQQLIVIVSAIAATIGLFIWLAKQNSKLIKQKGVNMK